jgi:hypothetical protein
MRYLITVPIHYLVSILRSSLKLLFDFILFRWEDSDSVRLSTIEVRKPPAEDIDTGLEPS